MAASYTSASTQPLLTEPAMRASFAASSVAPRGRGVEPETLTTVAIARRSPRARQARSSSATCFTSRA